MRNQAKVDTGGLAQPSTDRSAAKQAPVSVLVPCYRCKATTDEAIASIAAQTLLPAEVLLMDDCSGDGTLEALHRIASAHREDWIKVIALKDNGGPSRARNIGWQRATQPYVALLDADDTWAPRKLELQMAALEADSSIALIGHRMIVCPRGAPIPAPQEPIQTELIGRKLLLLRNPFPVASVIMLRDLPFRFDERVWHSEGYLLWSQILFSGYRCAKINQILAIWNQRAAGEHGLSDDVMAIHRARCAMRRRLLKEGLISPSEYLCARTVGVMTRIRRNLKVRLRTTDTLTQRSPYPTAK